MTDREHQDPGIDLKPTLEVGATIPSHNRMCFGCGREHETGLRMKMHVATPDSIHGVFTVRPTHQGAPGLIHGGILSAAFDEVLGAVGWLLGAPAVTGRLETDFYRPIPVDTEVAIVARVDRVEGRKVFLSGVARIDDGPDAARAAGIFIRVPLEHFARHGRPQDVAAELEGDS